MKGKKLLAGVMALAMAATSAVNVTAYDLGLPPAAEVNAAGDTGTYGDFSYMELADGTVSITKYNGSDEKVVIPAEIDGKAVTEIGQEAFYRCTSLTEIVIPDSVTAIGWNAFTYCTALTELNIPDSVTSIFNWISLGCSALTAINVSENNEYYASVDGVMFNKNITTIFSYPAGKEGAAYAIPDGVTQIFSNAFFGCTALTAIEIPDGVTSVGMQAFYGCTALPEIELPDSVISIDSYAFFGCEALTGIVIPDSVTSIGVGVFNSCTSLTAINVNESNEYYTSIDGVLFDKDVTSLIIYPTGKEDTTYAIPYGVTSIPSNTFSNCTSLTKIEIPDSVNAIGYAAFYWCTSLTEINIPDGVPTIADSLFSGCRSLTEIVIPDSVTEIGGSAFEGCTSLTEIKIPDSVIFMGNFPFLRCESLTSIKIPAGVEYIGLAPFAGCSSLLSIEVDEDNPYYTSVDGILFDKDETTLMAYPTAREDTSYIIPDSVTTIGMSAFSYCHALKEIVIPDGVTTIESEAFYRCMNLEALTIPASVTDVRLGMFEDENLYEFDNIRAKLTIYGCTGSSAETFAKENEITFIPIDHSATDEETGIEVQFGEGVAPETAEVVIEDRSDEQDDSSRIYDITLTDNGEEIQPDGDVVIRIPVPEGWEDLEIYLYHRDENGKLTEIAIRVSGGYITFTVSHFSEFILTTKELNTLKGDVNGNGKVDDLDVVDLARYLAGWNIAIEEAAADVNGDGIVSDLDVVMLARRLAGWNI